MMMNIKISDLEDAVKTNNASMVQDILTRYPAEVDRQFRDNVTALHIASRAGHSEIIKILANRGADLNCSDSEYRTPLHFAVNGNQPDAVELLLKLGADMDEEDENDESPPQLAHKNNYGDCVKKFLDVNSAVRLKKQSRKYDDVPSPPIEPTVADKTESSGSGETSNSPKCSRCRNEIAVVTNLPCGHVVSCFTCSLLSPACSSCGNEIKDRSFQENSQTKEYFEKITNLNKTIRNLKDQHTCFICCDRQINCVLEGCGHMYCHKCVRNSPTFPRVSSDRQTWVCYKCKKSSRYVKIFSDWLNNSEQS